MKRLLPLLFVLITGTGACLVHARAQAPSSPATEGANSAYDVPAFIAELERWSNILAKNPSAKEIAALRDSLPKQWTVQTPENTYTVPTEILDKELAAGATGMAKSRLDHLLREVQGYATRGPGKNGTARAELEKILAGPEFAAVRPPGPWELFRQRVGNWIGRMLYKIFGGIERYPIGRRILFWVIVIGCVGFVALWVIRFLAGRDRMETLPAGEIVSATRTWQEWIRDAREAATRGDFREAVHSGYWAGIARLEDNGVVPKDRTKTPREYLRLVCMPSPHELAPRPIYREPLTELTKRLERIWYANRGAGPDDFKDTLRQLEAMGCPLE